MTSQRAKELLIERGLMTEDSHDTDTITLRAAIKAMVDFHALSLSGWEGMETALRQWKCDACGGSGEYLNKSIRYPDDMGPASLVEELLPCKRCEQTGLHPIARQALAPLKSDPPSLKTGDE